MVKTIILTSDAFYAKKIKLTLIKSLNWENYFMDEETKEKWIEEYPHSEMHGGGPPQLRLIENFPWEATNNE